MFQFFLMYFQWFPHFPSLPWRLYRFSWWFLQSSLFPTWCLPNPLDYSSFYNFVLSLPAPIFTAIYKDYWEGILCVHQGATDSWLLWVSTVSRWNKGSLRKTQKDWYGHRACQNSSTASHWKNFFPLPPTLMRGRECLQWPPLFRKQSEKGLMSHPCGSQHIAKAFPFPPWKKRSSNPGILCWSLRTCRMLGLSSASQSQPHALQIGWEYSFSAIIRKKPCWLGNSVSCCFGLTGRPLAGESCFNRTRSFTIKFLLYFEIT